MILVIMALICYSFEYIPVFTRFRDFLIGEISQIKDGVLQTSKKIEI